MKPSKLTPGHNLMWESSRMMLPEHVGILQQHQKKFKEKKRPEIDEQQAEILSQRLSDALQSSYRIMLTLFHPYQDKHMTGRISKFNPETRKIQLDTTDEWIRFDDILDVEAV